MIDLCALRRFQHDLTAFEICLCESAFLFKARIFGLNKFMNLWTKFHNFFYLVASSHILPPIRTSWTSFDMWHCCCIFSKINRINRTRFLWHGILRYFSTYDTHYKKNIGVIFWIHRDIRFFHLFLIVRSWLLLHWFTQNLI